jgi:hypothetical protein
MDESTTTNEPTDTGVPATQPVDVDTQAAENQPAEPTTPPDSQEAEGQQTDENLAWLQESKGIDLSTPEGQAKAAAMYREAEKKIHATTQEKAQLNAALQQPQDAATDPVGIDNQTAVLEARLQAIETERSVERFFNGNPDAKAYEAKMAEMVTNDPNLNYLVNHNVLSVESLYQMARGADPSLEASLKTEGGREALQKVADKQQAKAVPGNATSSQMAASGPTRETRDAWYANLTADQRADPENQRILNSLL